MFWYWSLETYNEKDDDKFIEFIRTHILQFNIFIIDFFNINNRYTQLVIKYTINTFNN